MTSTCDKLFKIFSPDNNKPKTCEDPNASNQRFKGVETFLRRMANNLGNSPSHTEVKIISCIPIDVTDLQNKIISLEHQLMEATNAKGTTKKHAPVHTALIQPARRNTNTVLTCKCSEDRTIVLADARDTMLSQRDDGSSKDRKSTVSFLFPTLSSTILKENQPFILNTNSADKESLDRRMGSHHKTFFGRYKKKSTKKKEDPKPQLIYYARTENGPFTTYGISANKPCLDYSKPTIANELDKSYLADVIRRHFHPRVIEEFSDTSHFTSPICRDFHGSGYYPYDSDVCSCCHGKFQDVDKYISKNFTIEPMTTRLHNEFNKDVYYDSNLYDIVPVKEKTVKVPKEDKFSIKEQRRPGDIRCWPDSARITLRDQTTDMQHHTKTYTKINNYKKSKYYIQDGKNNVIIKTPKRYTGNKVDKKTGTTDTSKSFCIDCSEIYRKPMFADLSNINKSEKLGTEPVPAVFRKNAECLTMNADTKNLTIARSIQIDINSTETSTENTLDQIKSILQSVLEQVKTSPQVNHLPEKKDAVIQKGLSQSNMHTGSSLLYNFTYNNSWNTNPYHPTCSHQIPATFCYTNVPYRHPACKQHFPMLVHTPGHQRSECLCKNSSHKNTPAQKQADNTTANANKKNQEIQGEETKKLIQEIYKSLTLTMDFQKETSNSECDELKSVTNNAVTSDLKHPQRPIVAMSSVSKKDVQVEATMTPLSTTTVRSNYNPCLTGTESDAKRDMDHCLNSVSESTEHEILKECTNRQANVASTISEHDSEELTTDDESDSITETVSNVKEKKETKGIFIRMLGTVFNRGKQNKRKESKKQHLAHKMDDEKFESDSDDYQTIYSAKVNRPEQRFSYNNRSSGHKPRNHATYKPVREKAAQRFRNHRSPYMEQEYRRQWDEQLMFQENRGKRYASELPYSPGQSPAYWQEYEARSAIVDHHVPYRAGYSPVHGNPINTLIQSESMPVGEQQTGVNMEREVKSKFRWLKKPKLGLARCGDQWKKIILES